MKKAKVALSAQVYFCPKPSKALRSLEPALKKLARVHEHYINREPEEEISFWHNERPQIGLLAAAVWLCKRRFTALEEYGADKKEKGEKGRGDLYIKDRPTRHLRMRGKVLRSRS